MINKTTDRGRFTGSLARVVITSLVLLSLIPAAILAVSSFLRTRTLLADSTITQMQAVSLNFGKQLQSISDTNKTYLNDMLRDSQVTIAINNILSSPQDESVRTAVRYVFTSYLAANRLQGTTGGEHLLLTNTSGIVLDSTKLDWIGLDLSDSEFYKVLGLSNGSLGTLASDPLSTNQWMIFTSVEIFASGNVPAATLFITSDNERSKLILEGASSLLTTSKSFFLTDTGTLAEVDPGYLTTNIKQSPISTAHLNELNSIVNQGEGFKSFTTDETGALFCYVKSLPDLHASLVLEIPENTIYQMLNPVIPFSLAILGVAVLVSIVLTFYGTRQIVNSLTDLAAKASNFARGDWSQRAVVNRRDEIGLLADTFNRMVEQISELYRSMELKVEERTSQLRTASEVGQIATSASNRDEIIQRAVRLVVERFGFHYASIFTIDETGGSAVLQEYNSESGESKLKRGYRFPINPDSLVGWVSTNNQARTITNTAAEPASQSDLLLPETRSEIGIPISVGNQVLGVFEVQSKTENGFEAETVSVLQTLCNQIANGLQNLRLLEATQINLEETTLLYRASRQVSLTKSNAELIQTLINALGQTPYVSGIFSVEEDHLTITAITDPRSPNTVIASPGVTLPLQRVSARLNLSTLILIENLNQSSDFDNLLSYFSRRGCRSAAIFPVNEGKKLSKIIVLGSRAATPLTSTALQPFANLVEVINTTLERFSVLDDLQSRVSELQTFANMSEIISTETDLSHLYQVLHQQVSLMMGSDLSFAVAIYDSHKNTIHIPFMYENNEIIKIDSFPLGEGLTSVVVRTRKPLFLVKDTEVKAQELGARILGKTAKSWMGIPLIVGGEVDGVIIIQDTDHEERFTENDLHLFTTLAPQIGVAIRNAKLLTEMQDALQAYDQERFLLNTLMKAIPDRITFKNDKGNFIRVSRSYANDLGIDDPLNLINKSISTLIDPAQAAKIEAEEKQILESGQSIAGRIEKETIGDHDRWLLITKIPMIDEAGGRPLGLLGISHDITDLKSAQELSQQRAQQLQIASEIARDTSHSFSLEDTLAKSVNLIRDRFGFYHASIFLIDNLGNYAVLREASGEIGIKMKATGHRLAVGSQSIVGQSSFRKETLSINDVRKEPNYYPNPLLPETRAELAIPLIVGERVLGVIDVQSKQPSAFTPEAIDVLEILADQLAVAVLNATLFARTQENLAQHRLLHQITVASASVSTVEDALTVTVNALRTSRGGDHVSIFLVDNAGNLELKAYAGYEKSNLAGMRIKAGEGIQGRCAATRAPVRLDDTLTDRAYLIIDPEVRSELAVPIIYSDRLVGVLNLESPKPGAYDETDQEIFGSLGNTLGAILSNAELVQAVRRQVDRQRVLFEATSKIRRSVDIQSILETSTSEICRSLGAKRAHIEITASQVLSPTAPPVSENGGNNGHKQGQESGK